jgi:hypothetical protein
MSWLPTQIVIADAKNCSNQTFANRVNGNRLWAPSVAAGAIEETITPNKKFGIARNGRSQTSFG